MLETLQQLFCILVSMHVFSPRFYSSFQHDSDSEPNHLLILVVKCQTALLFSGEKELLHMYGDTFPILERKSVLLLYLPVY